MKSKLLSALLLIMLPLSSISCANERTADSNHTLDTARSAPKTEAHTPIKTLAATIWQWQYDTSKNQQLDHTALENLHDTLAPTEVQTMVIVKNGVIVNEYYKDGYDANTIFALHSCSKSLTSALLGIAIEQGYIAGTDVLLSEYFPEILTSDNDYLKEMTIWHLLTHTTGFDASDTANWEAWRQSENWVNYVLECPIIHKPGTVFNYFTGNTHLLSAIIQKATGQTLYEFGKDNLFEPMGMNSVSCTTDNQGISDGGNGFTMTVYDMAKFGLLFLQNGLWEGQQLISEQWINDSTTTQFTRSSGSANYGYQWWVRTFGDKRYEAYFAQGHYGQFIFVVPELNLVTVFTSHNTGSTSKYWDFMNRIVNACQE